jgi:HSP20 family protein
MAIMKWKRREEWDPFADLLDLQRQINRLFDISFSRNPVKFATEEILPAIDLYETNDSYVVEAELPGLKQNEIDVNIEEDSLVIKGEKKREKELKEDNYHRAERFYGKFERRIALPSNIDKDKVKASYKDGILKISIPKKEEAKPKQIKVEIE